MSAWEKCPACAGSGEVPNDSWPQAGTNAVLHHMKVCPVCDGQRIISVATGLPPRPRDPKRGAYPGCMTSG